MCNQQKQPPLSNHKYYGFCQRIYTLYKFYSLCVLQIKMLEYAPIEDYEDKYDELDLVGEGGYAKANLENFRQ